MERGQAKDGDDKSDEDAQSVDAATLVARHDTLHRLAIAHGAQGRGLYVRGDVVDVRAGEALLILPSSSLLHAGNAQRFLTSSLLPTSERPSHPSHWDSKTPDTTTVQITNEVSSIACHLPLTSVQALTLILALWRAKSEQKEQKHDDCLATLDVFLGTYPRTYAGLPLLWQLLVDAVDNFDESYKTMLSVILAQLPVHVADLTNQVYRRFMRDVCAIKAVQEHRPELLPQCTSSLSLTLEHLAWAWAGVNSRCVYLPLGLTPHADNFTLAPLLDMANHTMDKTRECKVRWLPSKALQLSAPPCAANVASQRPFQANDEVCISYGPHANGFLLAEYGFILPARPDKSDREHDDVAAAWRGNPYSEVHVDHIVQSMLDRQGATQAELKRCLLVDEGYWGQYTIHPYEAPPHPSYRLVLALRLLALDLTMPNCDDLIAVWKANVQGIRNDVGIEAESAVRKMLSDTICSTIIDDSRNRVSVIRQETLADAGLQRPAVPLSFGIATNDVHAAAETVITLLEEEEHIARLLQSAIARGETDW